MIDMTHKTFEERASTNFDHPDSLDTSLLVQHIRQLKNGETVEIPTYDFATHLRTDVTEQRVPRKIILVEGILIFTEPELVQELDMKIFVVRLARPRVRRFVVVFAKLSVSYKTNPVSISIVKDADSDIRLARRIARDTKERGRKVEDIIEQYHSTVRPMHQAYVEPSKIQADLIVHSTGHSMEVAIKTITNHLRVEAGLLHTE
jgi:uridine kinase